MTATVSYPDIYNRFRKLKGPIKASRPPKSGRTASQRPKPGTLTSQAPHTQAETASPDYTGVPGPSTFDFETTLQQPTDALPSQLTSISSLHTHAAAHIGPSLQAGQLHLSEPNLFDPASHHELAKALSSMSQEQVLQIGSHGGHDELARALLRFMTTGGAV